MYRLSTVKCKCCIRTFSNIIPVFKRLYHFTNDFGCKVKSSENEAEPDVVKLSRKSSELYQFVNAYREHGHKLAQINPVALRQERHIPELIPERYGLTFSNNCVYGLEGIFETKQHAASLSEIVEFLKNTYCSNLSIECSHVENEDIRDWLYSRYEAIVQQDISAEVKKDAAKELIKSQVFDRFLATKFVSLKRYGAEGAESMMPFFLQLFKSLSEDGVKDVIIGMPHRGRLNLLTGMLKLPPIKLFYKLAGNSEFPSSAKATGDVVSHLITSVDNIMNDGRKLHVATMYNPSHLEAVNPVSMGKTRGRHLSYGQGGYGDHFWGEEIVNIQVHGDGAIMGQGVNQEAALMSRLPFYEIGGSVHLIVNNQIAFTTPPSYGRGTRYPSDIAKIISAPVIHVNGDSPEDVIRAAILAVEYQRKYRQDIFVDLNCFRLWGHNELDDPTFTNPAIYKIIRNRKSVPDTYNDTLIKEGVLSKEDVEKIMSEYSDFLNSQLQQVDQYQPEEDYLRCQWNGYSQAPNAVTTWDTGVDLDVLQYIGKQSVTTPPNFNVHPTILKSHVQGRWKKLSAGSGLDWSTCEALALGSILYQGYNVRISGQDVGRGTFSHRHAMLVDQITNETFVPLNNLVDKQVSKLEIANSLLSEEAVLGFEYGMSIENPRNLVIWEAQFGDFFNGAQILIDTFITSGESKWMQCTGLVMLLPHGYDGAGPEHSSCRIERFLQMTDSSEVHPDGEDVNIHIANPTTPAQYFHLLRRQIIRNYRKPLIVVAPKTILRLSEATSSLTDLQLGTTFQPVIDDKWLTNKDDVKKIVFTSGKHYYAILKHRQESSINDVAIIRVEELCPFPLLQIQSILTNYKNAKHFIWSQEEPRNMGAWFYMKPRFENLLGKRLKYSGRNVLPTPAVGVGKVHKAEAESVIKQPFLIK